MDSDLPRKKPIAIDKRALIKYKDLFYFELGLFTFGISILLYFIIGKWYNKAWVKHYNVEIDGRYIKIEQGIIFKSKKSIPLDKITDFEWIQGPIMKLINVYVIRIDTASSTGEYADAEILAPYKRDLIKELEEHRDLYSKYKD